MGWEDRQVAVMAVGAWTRVLRFPRTLASLLLRRLMRTTFPPISGRSVRGKRPKSVALVVTIVALVEMTVVAAVVEVVSEMRAALVETAMSVAVALEATVTGEVEIAEEAMVADQVMATAMTAGRCFPRVPLLLGLRLSRRSLSFLLSRIRRRSPKSPFLPSRLP